MTVTVPPVVSVTSPATVPLLPLTVKLLVTSNVPLVDPANVMAAFVLDGTAELIDVNVMLSGPESVIATAGCVVEDVVIVLL